MDSAITSFNFRLNFLGLGDNRLRGGGREAIEKGEREKKEEEKQRKNYPCSTLHLWLDLGNLLTTLLMKSQNICGWPP